MFIGRRASRSARAPTPAFRQLGISTEPVLVVVASEPTQAATISLNISSRGLGRSDAAPLAGIPALMSRTEGPSRGEPMLGVSEPSDGTSLGVATVPPLVCRLLRSFRVVHRLHNSLVLPLLPARGKMA